MKRLVRFLNHFEEWTLVCVLLGLAFLTFIQVICRYGLGFSFPWMEELARYVGVFVTFLGAAIGVKYGVHFSMDFLYERISNDRFRHGLKTVVHILSGLLLLVVGWYGWDQTAKLYKFGVLTSTLQIQKFWFYLPVPLFSFLMAWRFFRLAIKHVTSLVRGEPYEPFVLE